MNAYQGILCHAGHGTWLLTLDMCSKGTRKTEPEDVKWHSQPKKTSQSDFHPRSISPICCLKMCLKKPFAFTNEMFLLSHILLNFKFVLSLVAIGTNPLSSPYHCRACGLLSEHLFWLPEPSLPANDHCKYWEVNSLRNIPQPMARGSLQPICLSCLVFRRLFRGICPMQVPSQTKIQCLWALLAWWRILYSVSSFPSSTIHSPLGVPFLSLVNCLHSNPCSGSVSGAAPKHQSTPTFLNPSVFQLAKITPKKVILDVKYNTSLSQAHYFERTLHPVFGFWSPKMFPSFPIIVSRTGLIITSFLKKKRGGKRSSKTFVCNTNLGGEKISSFQLCVRVQTSYMSKTERKRRKSGGSGGTGGHIYLGFWGRRYS